jgi:multidrug efflux pump subunit AcrA (membrane-fusion protein)
MKYIQSFHQYPVTFSTVAVTIPAKNADGETRNICEVSEEILEKLQNGEPLFRALVNKKKYRILNKMPESYKPAARQINEALAEAKAAKAELEAAKAELAKLKGESTGNSDEQNTEPKVDETPKTDETEAAKAELEAAKAEKNFDEMSYPELQAEVKKLGGNHTQKKDVLIEFLKNATANAAE